MQSSTARLSTASRGHAGKALSVVRSQDAHLVQRDGRMSGVCAFPWIDESAGASTVSGAGIVHERQLKYGSAGQVRTEEAYMKFLESFLTDGSLRRLKGAPLSAFIAVGLHEVQVILHGVSPFMLSDIEQATGYSRPTLSRALDRLVADHFLCELPRSGKNGEKQYRVDGYLWFGNRPHAGRRSKDSLLREKIFSHDDDDIPESLSPEIPHHHHSSAEARKIFLAAGVAGKNLDRLARSVAPAHARAWVESLGHAPASVQSPIGVMVAALLEDPEAPVQWRGHVWYDQQYESLICR